MKRRNVAIAIGVGDAKPLVYLGGATNGAHAFHTWASQLGYESRLITDQNEEITLERLRSEFDSVLDTQKGPIHRLVIYFAGHGLIREAEEGLWLLSDWYKELRAVAVEGLKRRLYMHDIQQVAIFADCCRSLPTNFLESDLAADPVLGRGPNRDQKPPAIDKFIAAQDGTATFMVPGATPNDDRCLFSGVLIEALWGTKPDAFSSVVRDKITSRSLGRYLELEVPKLAKRYNRELVPSVSPTFPEGDDIYFPEGGKPMPPAFPEWPEPEVLDVTKNTGQPPHPGYVVGVLNVGDERTEISFPQQKIEDESKAAGKRLIEEIRNQERPDHFEFGAGFVVGGGLVQGFWVPEDVFAEPHLRASWWRIREKHEAVLVRSAPVLIEFEDGMFAAVTALPGFIASVLRVGKRVSALVYREIAMPTQIAAITEEAISEMENGALRADDALDLAVKLRRGKHADPVLGVISAYLYDSVGDIENIRRMAFYYVNHHQPIPYDIALLGRLRGGWRDGRLWAKVPAVSERKPRTETEELNTWTFSETPAASGEVGGFWPWMRQGWSFLDDPSDDGSTLILSGLMGLVGHLAPARFTTFKAEGGKRLAELFNLRHLTRPPS